VSAVEALERSLASIAGAVGTARPRIDVEPLPMVAPSSIEQVAELLRFARRDELRVLPFGLGSKLGWCGIPGHVDFLLSTRNLGRVISHVPDDGTISVEAGLTMAELKRRCREGGHFLTPDVPFPERRTIGGVVAAGESGADRLRYGPVRHHVLGTKVVLADGTVAKSGGQLVKNVTGFDLHRLYAGSHGTLCVVAEVSLRLFPEPEHEAFASLEVAPGDEHEAARRALALPARCVSITIAASSSEPRARLHARLFGRREALEDEIEQLLVAWPGATFVEGSSARAAAERARDRTARAGSVTLHASCGITKSAGVRAKIERVLADAGAEWTLLAQPGVAVLDYSLSANARADLRELLAAARKAAESEGGALSVRDAPREALLGFDPFGEPAAGLDLMRAVQRKLDPSGVFRSGRFHGGL
jgi:glycolate oxidase FAD binding subunit